MKNKWFEHVFLTPSTESMTPFGFKVTDDVEVRVNGSGMVAILKRLLEPEIKGQPSKPKPLKYGL